jgi:hypothetical protein
MNCGECKKWARCGMTNHGVCGTTNLYTRDHEGAKCTISEPREVEPKPLRDGDIFWLDNGFYCHFHDNTGPCIIAQKQHGQITSDRKFLFNLLSLAAAVKEYGLDIPAILAAVQRGEKLVTLTKEETCDILEILPCAMQGIKVKLRAAIGGGQ